MFSTKRLWVGALVAVSLLLTVHTPVRADTTPIPTAIKAEPDADGDGLSDWQEQYKYLTNPNHSDSDGDGIPDGDWEERREITYSVRARMRLVRPWNTAVMNDDFQDVRVLSETKEYLTIEAVLYPQIKTRESMSESRTWQADDAAMAEYLKPGITANWDAQMQKALLADLARAGIYPTALSDRALVEQVSAWAMRRAKQIPTPVPPFLMAEFSTGTARILPDLQASWEMARGGNTTDYYFSRDLYGRQMYELKEHGGCSGTSVYLATIFRALGAPELRSAGPGAAAQRRRPDGAH